VQSDIEGRDAKSFAFFFDNLFDVEDHALFDTHVREPLSSVSVKENEKGDAVFAEFVQSDNNGAEVSFVDNVGVGTHIFINFLLDIKELFSSSPTSNGKRPGDFSVGADTEVGNRAVGKISIRDHDS